MATVADEAVDVAIESPASAAALIDALDRHLERLYPPEHNHLLALDALLAPEVTFAIARRRGAAIGCGALLRHGRAFVEIKRMYVVPDARGSGAGCAILRFLERIARGEGFRLARLETGGLQPEALRLYERAGYRRAGAFAAYRDDGVSLFYERRLDDDGD